MFTLDATLGSSTANSFVASLEEAETYVAYLRALPGLGASVVGWTTAGSPQSTTRTFALIQAASNLRSLTYLGREYSTTQALPFPRSGVPVAGMNQIIPVDVKLAQVAEACWLLSAANAGAGTADRSLISESNGGVSMEWDRSAKAREAERTISAPAEGILRKAGLLRGGVWSFTDGRG